MTHVVFFAIPSGLTVWFSQHVIIKSVVGLSAATVSIDCTLPASVGCGLYWLRFVLMTRKHGLGSLDGGRESVHAQRTERDTDIKY